MKLLATVLVVGINGFKVPSIVLLCLGIATIVFGLLPGVNFFTELPNLRGIVRKPLPRWFGRLWFVGAGALFVYWGLAHR
jgi:hypothetical protein